MKKLLYCLTIVNIKQVFIDKSEGILYSMPSDLSMNTCLRGFYMKEVSFAFLTVCARITITFNFDTLHMLFFSEHMKEGSESDR